MKGYCSQCKSEGEGIIDLMEIALQLDNGLSEIYVCYTCNNCGMYKDEEGKIYLLKKVNKELELVPVNLEELFKINPNG